MKKMYVAAIGLVFMVAHFYMGMGPIKNYSATYDEPVHLTAGYAALVEKNYELNGYGHPPFGEMWCAAGLTSEAIRLPVHDPYWIHQNWNPKAQYQFSDKFVFHNMICGDDMLERGRIMQLILSCLFIGMLGLLALYAGGAAAAITAMGLASFSSTLLAHASLVTTDLSFSIFFFLFFATLAYMPSWGGAMMAGVFLGLSLASKFSVLLLGPIFTAIVLFNYFVLKKKLDTDDWIRTLTVTGAAVITLLSIYRMVNIDIFLAGIGHFFKLSREGRSSFFWGHYEDTGTIAYFPAAFLLKTEIPLLLAMALAITLIVKKKLKLSPLVWIPPSIFFVIVVFSKVQIGHRHILPVYPFLFLITGLGLALLPAKGKYFLISILIGWMGIEAKMIRPNYLSYFNPMVGGSSQGFKYFSDSNVDWGQGLKSLASILTEEDKSKGIYLSYFGAAEPHAYGIKYLDTYSDPPDLFAHRDDREEPNMSPTKFAVSVTNLQCTYYSNRDFFNWLKKYKPIKVVSDSIFIYDFSNSPEELQRLKLIHESNRIVS